jgi:ABC-type transport system involved in Fe-S cluster assembly fused permease/ATPase subunit
MSVIHGDLTIGDWVALQAWVSQIFIPLNYLGSVYGAIIQALVDVKNLSGIVIDIIRMLKLILPSFLSSCVSLAMGSAQ